MRNNAAHYGMLVVGLGSIGQRHLANLIALGVPRPMAMDLDPARRENAKQRFGTAVEVFEDLEAALDARPKAAVICTPSSRHMAPALAAARGGCNLLIEKPLSHSPEGVDELLRLVATERLTTLVGCNMRFHPGPARIKSLLAEGVVGNVASIRLEVGQYLPDWHPQEDYRRMYSARKDLGGGILLDAIHEIDLARWFGGEVSSVSCMTSKTSHLEIETEENAALLMRYAGGALGEVHLDYIQRAYSRTCHVIGDAGSIRWEYGGEVRLYTAATRAWTSWAEPAGWVPNDMYLDEMRHFLRCLDSREQPIQDVAEGAQVLRLALAAKGSAEAGGAPRTPGKEA